MKKKIYALLILLISSLAIYAQTELTGEICEEAIPMHVGESFTVREGTTYYELFVEDFMLNHVDEEIKLHFVNNTDDNIVVTATVYLNCRSTRPMKNPETRTIAAHKAWNPTRGVEYNMVYTYWDAQVITSSVIIEIVSSGVVTTSSEYHDPASQPTTALNDVTVSRGFGGSLQDLLDSKGITTNNIQLLDITGRTVTFDPAMSMSVLNAGIYILRTDKNAIKLQVR
ncbi:MAG TPA: hypothetical protein DEO38_03860 [Bacteroidales bacterium]|nr:hypothetical protein [Bacteroidales bacterium]